jgi:hypothetical protein
VALGALSLKSRTDLFRPARTIPGSKSGDGHDARERLARPLIHLAMAAACGGRPKSDGPLSLGTFSRKGRRSAPFVISRAARAAIPAGLKRRPNGRK